MKFASYDIVFQEIPNEVTLAINISNCPNRCAGCHSPHLQEDIGEELDENAIEILLEKYGKSVSCVCFMGGDNSPKNVLHLAKLVKQFQKKTAWYSGNPTLYENAQHYFNYIKLGQYIEELGGLNTPTTNQRFYRIDNGKPVDMTNIFQK